MDRHSPGLLREESRCTFQNPDILAELPVLFAQSFEFVSLVVAKSCFDLVRVSICNPAPNCRLDEIEILRNLADTAVTALASGHYFGFELRTERSTRTSFLSLLRHGLHDGLLQGLSP